MSAQRSISSSSGGATEKQSANVYTMMLVIALIALITACVLLYMELAPYGDFFKWWDTSAATSWLTHPAMDAPLRAIG